MDFISVKCPNCNSNISSDEDSSSFFAQHVVLKLKENNQFKKQIL